MVECNDKNCYIHGALRIRGGRATGVVVSNKPKHTVIIERSTISYLPKYRRWAHENSRIAAHNPQCISAKQGDNVRIGETRKISKTKAWTIIDFVKKDIDNETKKSTGKSVKKSKDN